MKRLNSNKKNRKIYQDHHCSSGLLNIISDIRDKYYKTSESMENMMDTIMTHIINIYGMEIDLVHSLFPRLSRGKIQRKMKNHAKAAWSSEGSWSSEEDGVLRQMIKENESTNIHEVLVKLPNKSISSIVDRVEYIHNTFSGYEDSTMHRVSIHTADDDVRGEVGGSDKQMASFNDIINNLIDFDKDDSISYINSPTITMRLRIS